MSFMTMAIFLFDNIHTYLLGAPGMSAFVEILIFFLFLHKTDAPIKTKKVYITVKTHNIGTPRPATVVVLKIKQFNFTMK